MFLKSKANNSIGYCTLPMLNIDIKLEYIIDVNNDINDTLVLKLYNTGLAPCIKYINYLRSRSNYVKEEGDMMYFKVYDNHVKDYHHIVNGEYKKISKTYVKYYNDYFNSVLTHKAHHKNIIRLARMIVNNNETTWKSYWSVKLKDLNVSTINWILKLMDKSGNYYSKSDKWNITNTEKEIV